MQVNHKGWWAIALAAALGAGIMAALLMTDIASQPPSFCEKHPNHWKCQTTTTTNTEPPPTTTTTTTEPPPTTTPAEAPLWNADLSTCNRTQYGNWEYGGTFDGTPPLSERVAVSSSIDGVVPAQGPCLMRLITAPGDQYGGSSGWRTLTRLPPEYTNGGQIVKRQHGYDSSYTWAIRLPTAYPGDANVWQTGTEWHQSGQQPTYCGSGNVMVAPMHFRIFSSVMQVDVAGNTTCNRIEYVNQQFYSGYEKNKWYVFTERYKHGVYPNGHYELWGGKKGTATQMTRLIYAPSIGTAYRLDDGTNVPNYMLFGLYRATSGTSNMTAYFGGFREYASLNDALVWAQQILRS